MKDISEKTPTAFPLQGVWVRFSGKSDMYLSSAYQRDAAHIEFAVWKTRDFYNKPSGSLAGYQTIMQAMVTIQQRFDV